jgi:hypothetical protein
LNLSTVLTHRAIKCIISNDLFIIDCDGIGSISESSKGDQLSIHNIPMHNMF